MVKIDSTRLKYLLESHNDSKGHEYFVLISCLGRLKFSSIASVTDLIVNNSLGYVEQ